MERLNDWRRVTNSSACCSGLDWKVCQITAGLKSTPNNSRLASDWIKWLSYGCQMVTHGAHSWGPHIHTHRHVRTDNYIHTCTYTHLHTLCPASQVRALLHQVLSKKGQHVDLAAELRPVLLAFNNSLERPSWVKCWQVVCFDQTLPKSYFCKLGSSFSLYCGPYIFKVVKLSQPSIVGHSHNLLSHLVLDSCITCNVRERQSAISNFFQALSRLSVTT